MSCTREFIRRVIKNSPKVVSGKKYDFYAKECNKSFMIYQRDYEGKPWEIIIKVDKDKIESNEVGAWNHFERSYKIYNTIFYNRPL